MNPDDNTKDPELDFGQLDQEINQLMQQKPAGSNDHHDSDELNSKGQPADTWSAISHQLKSENKPELDEPQSQTQDKSETELVPEPAAQPSQPPKLSQSPKPRGYVMDFMHPVHSSAGPNPKKPQEDLPVGDDYLISAKASPDKTPEPESKRAITGYGSGGFSVKETDQLEQKIDEAPSISAEKEAFKKEVDKFEDEPIDDAPEENEPEQTRPDTTLESETGALPANNLVKQAPKDNLSSQTEERPPMFDTKEYVQPLKPPIKIKKSSEKFWIIILIILIVIVLGLAAGYYLLILGR